MEIQLVNFKTTFNCFQKFKKEVAQPPFNEQIITEVHTFLLKYYRNYVISAKMQNEVKRGRFIITETEKEKKALAQIEAAAEAAYFKSHPELNP